MFLDELFQYEWCPIGGRRGNQFRAGWQKHAATFRRELLAKAQVFNVSNVADYLYRDVGEDGWDYSKDFPRPMPPFACLWAEWAFPKESRRTRGADLGRFWVRSLVAERMGCLMLTEKNEGQYAQYGDAANVAWTIRFAPFIRPFGRHIIGVGPEIIMGLDADFSMVNLGDKNVLVNFPVVSEDERPEWDALLQETAPSEDDCTTEVIALMNVPLLAMSLLNCRNVRTKTIQTDARLIRANQKRSKHTTAQSNVIEIQPIVNHIRHITGKAGYSRAAAPIIRGHFKDYTERGLFGKVKGIFWWDQRINAPTPKEYRLKNAIGDLDEEWQVTKKCAECVEAAHTRPRGN